MNSMNNTILRQGLDTFDQYIADELVKVEGKTIRTAGRATKANPDGEDEKWWRENGPKQVEAWLEWRLGNPNLKLARFAGTPAVEVEVNATFDNGVTLRGYIDRVFVDESTGEYLIVDIKTGSRTPLSPLQLAFYRVALEQTLNVSPRYGAYWMGRQGTLSAVQELWYPTEMIVSWLEKARVIIDNELFIPHVTMFCGSCGVKDHCTAQNFSAAEAEYKVKETA